MKGCPSPRHRPSCRGRSGRRDALAGSDAPSDGIPPDLPSSSPDHVRVEIEASGLPASGTLVIPRAIPMGYGEAPYDRFVSGVEAYSAEGKPALVRRGEGPRWEIEGRSPIARVVYEVDLARMEKEIAAASDASKRRARYVGILGVLGVRLPRRARGSARPARGPRAGRLARLFDAAPSAPASGGAVRAAAPDFYALADSQIAMGPGLRVLRLEGVAALPRRLCGGGLGRGPDGAPGARGPRRHDGLLRLGAFSTLHRLPGDPEADRPGSLIRLQHGASGKLHGLLRRAGRDSFRRRGGHPRAGPLQLRAPHRARLDSQSAATARATTRSRGSSPP